MKEIGQKIKLLRIKKGINQSDIYEKAGISRSTYYLLENGKFDNLTIKSGIIIADILGVSFNELFETETLKNNHEINRLKSIVFQSLELYEYEQIFFGQFEHDHLMKDDFEKWEEYQQKFEEYSKHLKEFKRGILKILILNGFCTQEDVTDFYNYIHHRGKYADSNPV